MKHRYLYAAVCIACLPAQAGIFSSPVVFATGSGVGANVSGPDSISVGNGSVWVAYVPRTTSSTGGTGSSTVVQYSMTGAKLNSYTLAGSVDGLKINPYTGAVWALQNQDGNSTLSVIDPVGKTVQSYNYAPPVSAGSGYDDVIFTKTQTFLSYTNPGAPGDAVLQTLGGLTTPLQVTTIATYGASPDTLNDPDSLKLDNKGNLVLTSGDDGTLNFFNKSGAFEKVISITQNGAGVSGLDDSFFAPGGSGTLFFTDPKTNSVYTVAASNLTAGSIYAAVGSANAIGLVDPSTGNFTPVITDGVDGSVPHGLDFAPTVTPEPAVNVLLGAGLGLLALARRRFQR